MHDRHARGGPALAILVFLSLAVAASAESRPEAQPGTVDAKDEAVPVAVPPSEIAGRVTDVSVQLRRIEKQVEPDETQRRIESELPDLIRSIADYASTSVNREIGKAPLKLLNDSRQQWIRFDTNLLRWSRDLDERAEMVAGILDELAFRKEVWRLTAAATTDLPAAVGDQVTLVLSELDGADRRSRSQQATLLTLQNQVSEQRIIIAETLAALDDEMEDRHTDLFQGVVGPLWRPVGADGGSLNIGHDLEATWVRVADGMSEFWQVSRARLLWFGLGIVVLAGFMWLLGHRVVADDDSESGVAVARAILRRPIAAAGLLATVVSSWLIFADAPLVIHSVLPMAALPFAAMLTPALVPPERRRMIYWVLVLAFLVNFEAVIVTIGALRQFTLILVAVLGIIGLAMFRRRMRREDPVIWPRTSIVVLGLGWLAFATTLIAVVTGYLLLGELVANATVESAYVAFLLLAGYRISDALVVLAMKTRALAGLQVVQKHGPAIRGRALLYVRIIATFFWTWAFLDRLTVLDPVRASLVATLSAVLEIGTLKISLGSIILFFVVLWFALQIAKIVSHILEDDVLPRSNMPRGRSHAVSMLVNYFVVGIGFLIALASAGFQIEQLALVGGALGVGIGFGLQNVVSNFVSGLILVFERPVQVGDTIEVGTLIGTVRRIGIRSSTVRTFDEAEVIVPNSDLISSHVVNWTLSDQLRRMEVKVGVAYGTDPVQVQQILVAVAREHAKVLEYPSPYSLFKGFGDSSLDFVVRFWTSDFGNWIFIASEVTVGIEKALGEAGIVIPFPQRDLHVVSVDPPAPMDDSRLRPPPTPTDG